MNSKFLTVLFAGIAILSMAFGVYYYDKASMLGRETEEWKLKYEEAIVDAEEAGQRLEELNEKLQVALAEAEIQKSIALKALEESQKKSRK